MVTDPGVNTLRLSLNPANSDYSQWTQPTDVTGPLPLTVTLDAEYTFSETTAGEQIAFGQTHIDWGDGTHADWGDSSTSRTVTWHPIPGHGITHTYDLPGTYTVTVHFTAPTQTGQPSINGVPTSATYPPIDLTVSARVTVTDPNPEPVALLVVPGGATYSFS